MLDTTAPVLYLVQPVSPNPTTSTAPSIIFNTNEAGTIYYNGDCNGNKSAAAVGNNSVTLSMNTPSPYGTHSNCALQVKDAAGNYSSWLPIPSFTIQQQTQPPVDTTAPILSSISQIGNTYDTTPTRTFKSSEAGTILYQGACQSGDTSALASPYTTSATFNPLAYGTYSTCLIAVKDAANNQSLWYQVPTFTVLQQGGSDTTKPELQMVSAVTPNPTTDTTPSIVFWSSEAGTITYNGGCASGTTNAVAGTNSITFNALAYGTYSCQIRVTDASGNVSDPLQVGTFTVQQSGSSDTTPPSLGNASSIGSTYDTTPDFSFTASESGNIIYNGDCSSSTTWANAGSNTVTLNTLAYGTHSNCYITVKDSAGNESAVLAIPAFTILQSGSGGNAPRSHPTAFPAARLIPKTANTPT